MIEDDPTDFFDDIIVFGWFLGLICAARVPDNERGIKFNIEGQRIQKSRFFHMVYKTLQAIILCEDWDG